MSVDEEFRGRLDELGNDEFQQLYGRWEHLLPADATVLLAGCDALWWAEPWLLDVLVTPHDGNRWAFHRDTSVVEDIESVTWVADDGATYLRPEIALASKAKLARPKDTADFDVVIPLLEPDARQWLEDVLARVHPGHSWLNRLG